MKRGTTLKTVGLFTGVGGFEFGLAKAGHSITSLCEIDPAARAVLRCGIRAKVNGVPGSR